MRNSVVDCLKQQHEHERNMNTTYIEDTEHEDRKTRTVPKTGHRDQMPSWQGKRCFWIRSQPCETTMGDARIHLSAT